MTNNIGLDWLRAAATDGDLKMGVFPTLVLIFLDCWDGDNISWTDTGSAAGFARRWNMDRTTAWRHIAKLIDLGWIESQEITPGFVRLKPSSLLHGCNTRCNPAQVVEGSINPKDSQLNNKVQVPTTVARLQRITDATPREVDQELKRLLLQHQVVGGALATLLTSEHVTVEYATLHFEKVKRTEGEGCGLAIRRMLDGVPAPEKCGVCGGFDGKHLSGDDEFSSIVMCPREDRPNLTAEECTEIYGSFAPWER